MLWLFAGRTLHTCIRLEGISTTPVDRNDNCPSRIHVAYECLFRNRGELVPCHQKVRTRTLEHLCKAFLCCLAEHTTLLFLRKVYSNQTILSQYIFKHTATRGAGIYFLLHFSLGWRWLGMNQLMLWTDNSNDHSEITLLRVAMAWFE